MRVCLLYVKSSEKIHINDHSDYFSEKISAMKILSFIIVLICCNAYLKAQDDIVLDLDSIKNIKTSRYSSINDVGVAINVAGKFIQKFPGNTQKTTLNVEKPSVMFRTVHGVLVNPKLFIGAGAGIDFLPSQTGGTRAFSLTFPLFAEFREYILDGNFNVFFSQRLGGAFFIDSYRNQQLNSGRYSGAFGEFMIGGRYVTNGKKVALHFGVGYRLQHLQRKANVQDIQNGNPLILSNIPQVTIKHYVPITIGVTF